MPNPVSSKVHDASNNNILSALQASKGDAVRNDEFSRTLENSVRSQDRPTTPRPEQAPPREASRGETRRQTDSSDQIRRNRSESRPADKADRSAGSGKTADTESTGSKPAAGQDTSAGEDAGATEAVSAAEAASASAAQEPGTEILPANLAVLASIIAALEKAATGQASASAEAETESDLIGSTRRSAGAVLSGLLEKTAGKGGESTRDAAAKDTAGALAAKDTAIALVADTKQQKADAGTISGNFSRVLATLAQPQTYSAPVATALQALAAETPATPAVMPQTVVPGLRTEQSGIPQLQLHTPTGQRVWAEEVGNRLMFMVGRGESRAELVLTPPSLGKLSVSIQSNGDQTTAHFVASSSAAREALEQALPRLREALQQAGINLGQTDVSTSNGQHTAANGGQNGHGPSSNHRGDSDPASDAMELAPQQSWTRAGPGLIDTFA